jgi:enediyne biosynthesis protein E4
MRMVSPVGSQRRLRVVVRGWARLAVAIVVGVALSAGCRREQGAPAGPPKAAPDDKPATALAAPPGGTADFVERAAALGIEATYRNGGEADQFTILESLGGGVGWFDFDRDGWLDLVATGGGTITADEQITGLPCQLFRSRDGRAFRPVATEAGIVDHALYSHGVAVGDHDNDGFQDLIVTGYGVPHFWRNMGDGTFTAAPSPAGEDTRWSSSAGWGDLDGDGILDLYLARYVNWSFDNHPLCTASDAVRDICAPRSFEGLPDAVYLGNGDGTFTDASAAVGLRQDGKGLGVLLADLDVDGDLDVYVANDTTDNFLYVNDGHGHLAEMGLVSGTALDDQGVPNGSMGIDLCDFNRDGLPDLWVTNFEREWFALYRNEGRGYFLHVSRRYGITDIGGMFVGFGTVVDDFNADGWGDIVVTNGHVIKHPDDSPLFQEPLFLRFDGDRFRRGIPEPGSYFALPHMGRGLASGDYDGDGDLDLAIAHVEAPVAILENRFPQSGRSILVQLVGTVSNRDAVGARLEVIAGSAPSPAIQVTGGGSYLSHSDRRLHVVVPAGAGGASPAPALRLRIRWPSGIVQDVALPGAQRELRIVESGDLPGSAPGTESGGPS